MNIFYEYGDNLYVNLTNECPMNCTFCERQYTDKIGAADSLWLDHEPSMIEVLTELSKWNMANYKQLVFCGFGEPTERLDLLIDVANIVKRHNNISIRLNTNGLANLINGKDVVPRFKDVIDIVSISLNAPNAETYLKLTQSEYGLESFQAMLDFAVECKDYVRQVIMTTVSTTITEEEEQQCAKICEDLGVVYSIRPYEDHGSGVFPNPETKEQILPDGTPAPNEKIVNPLTQQDESEKAAEENASEETAEEAAPEEEEAAPEATEEASAPAEEEAPAQEEEAPAEKEAPAEPEKVVAEEPKHEEKKAPAKPAKREAAGGREVKLYLASSSPRRKDLLDNLGIPFECIPSDIVEDTSGKTPGEAVQAVALAKAEAVAETVPGPAVIIGADTLISLHGDIYGKPSSEDDAVAMLSELQGAQHRVYTGVAIVIKARAGHKSETFSDFTKVKMVEMSEKEIREYIKTGEPMDKAGAYAIQGIGARYIESIEGNYTTVVGLPMHILYAKLKNIRGVFPNR